MTNEEKLAEEYRKELKERLLRNDDYERLEMFDENVEEAYLAGRKSNSEVIAELSKRAIKWVKIAEGMPANCTCVLCALKDGGLETAYYEDGDFTFCAPAIHVQDVAAWAYIPEYKE